MLDLDASDILRRKMAGESAENEAGALARRSRLERLNPDQVRFDLTWDDVEIEQPIGYGGFSQVFRVSMIGDPERNYALKCLNPQTKLHPKTFKTGAVDLAIEGEILSRLEHENVIKLHGISGGGPLQAYMNSDRGYFIVLDLLDDTLASKLDKYREIYKGGKSGSSSMGMSSSRSRNSSGSSSSSTSKHMSQSNVLERVSSVALGVAKGMEYLHSQGVALRDLKPDNIGFDEKGVPKLFDLGFAREVHTIKPTEVAGSLRYMAPEVARGLGSELASDVYSFGILLWEICTLEKPYKHITSRDDFMQSIVIEEWRHTTSKIPSNSLRKLIKECWQTDPAKRPTFNQIVKKLRVELSLSKTTTTEAVPNKGFGSSVNIKRTATWTKKLAGGISNSSLGVLRLGFQSSNSFAKNSESTASTSAASSESGGVGRSRSRSPKRNAAFSPMKSSPNHLLGMGSPMFSRLQNTTIAEGSEPVEQPVRQPKIRRALPSCPQITSVKS